MVRKSTGAIAERYVYNVANRLTRIEDEATNSLIAEYYYDPFGRRLWKEVNGARTYFFYSDEGLVAEYDSSGNELRAYGYQPDSTWSTNPLFLKQDDEYFFYQNDHLGTPQKLVDESGTVVWEALYDAFGNAQMTIEDIENNLRFPGQYFDTESGLHYNLKRYYEPENGRYTKVDPTRFEGGTHLYTYTGNNPINWIDFNGLKTIVIITKDEGDFFTILFGGSHAAIYIDNSGNPAIYDPAGSYGDRQKIGSGDLIDGLEVKANLTDYLNYHRKSGSDVFGFFFNTLPDEEEALLKKMKEIGGGAALACTAKVSDVLVGIGPFKNLEKTPFPGSLYDALEKLELQKD